MKIINKYTQYEIVCEKDPQRFQEKLNDAMRSLKEKSPEATIDENGGNLLATIKYIEQVEIEAEALAEEGAKFKCEDCPMFEPEMKRDGTRDMRKKYGGCPHAEMHRTWKDAPACKQLYRMIKNGDIGLTRIKEERSVELEKLTEEQIQDLMRRLQ